MLGLPRGTVALVEYDERWPDAFARASAEILATTKEFSTEIAQLEHVGSTSVPGLAAKPIIDLALALGSLSVFPMIQPLLERDGWLHRGFINAEQDDVLLVKESAPHIRTHHLHVVEVGSEAWREHVWFRDALRRDAALRSAYSELKNTLAQQFRTDRPSYTAEKGRFIAAAIRRARSSSSP